MLEQISNVCKVLRKILIEGREDIFIGIGSERTGESQSHRNDV